MSDKPPARRRAFVVEDSPLQRKGIVELLKEQGYEVVAECDSYGCALLYLRTDCAFSLIMVDKQIPEQPGEKPQEGVGPNLLLQIKKDYPFIGPLVLYTQLMMPNIGDIQRVYQAGASALATPPGEKIENFVKALDLIASGHQVLSPLFSRLGAGAVDLKRQCPLDPVEFFCARLISEHRGKEGSAERWGPGITVNIIDELLDDLYDQLSICVRGFAELPKEKKQQKLAVWYHDYAVKLYGTAAPVAYESRRLRRQKWPRLIFDSEEQMEL